MQSYQSLCTELVTEAATGRATQATRHAQNRGPTDWPKVESVEFQVQVLVDWLGVYLPSGELIAVGCSLNSKFSSFHWWLGWSSDPWIRVFTQCRLTPRAAGGPESDAALWVIAGTSTGRAAAGPSWFPPGISLAGLLQRPYHDQSHSWTILCLISDIIVTGTAHGLPPSLGLRSLRDSKVISRA